MTFREDEDWPEGFVETLRRDAACPPAASAQEAARRVRAALPPRPTRRRRRWLVPVAAAGAVVIALASTSRVHHEAGPEPRPRLTEQRPPVVGPLPDNIVLWWADPETPVYFILPAGGTSTGGQS